MCIRDSVRGPQKLNYYTEPSEPDISADPVIDMLSREQIEKMISATEKKMKEAAKDLDFISAAQFRDELFALKKKLKEAF